MVELVDTRDLGSRALGRAGSTPVPGTSTQSQIHSDPWTNSKKNSPLLASTKIKSMASLKPLSTLSKANSPTAWQEWSKDFWTETALMPTPSSIRPKAFSAAKRRDPPSKLSVQRGRSPVSRILFHPPYVDFSSHLSLRLLPGDQTDEQPFPCSVLHCERFTLPPRLPSARWALTPPFHPYLPKKAVCFLRYYLSSGPLGPLSLPFKRHTAL